MQFPWLEVLLADVALVLLGLWTWSAWDDWRFIRKCSPLRRSRRRRGMLRNYD